MTGYLVTQLYRFKFIALKKLKVIDIVGEINSYKNCS